MSKNKYEHDAQPNDNEKPEVELNDVAAEEGVTVEDDVLESEDENEDEALKDQLDKALKANESMKKDYMFLMAEFDNFKKRTLKEKSELLKNAAESTLKGLLPIVDDFERGLDAIKDSSDVSSVKEGMELIYNKLIKYLAANGVKPIESTGAEFDADLHEAIAMVPTPDESQRGKVIDTVEKGYTLNDKVIRHAKVAVGQ
ncbi:MAG: nucleotide exchange factor GrpE [Muribaculaceae bacterium]|nr:nucleotide exchange factor GrpE [Muribaculaceae bacterium]